MKESFYFSHDYSTRSDSKIKKLIAKHGYLGYGLFWAIIEDLYQNANAMQTDYDTIAFDLRTDSAVIKSIVNDFELFIIDGDIFYSESINSRLKQREEKSQKARESALYRWGKSDSNANVMRTQSDSNAIKERKEKERKGKKRKNNIDIKEIRESFLNQFSWKESICMNYHLSSHKIDNAINEFFNEQELKGDDKRSELDYKSHFVSWIKINKKNYERPKMPN